MNAGRIPPASAAMIVFSVVLAGCAAPQQGAPATRANAETVAACRQHADQVYDRRHRDTIYSPAQGTNTPFSGNYAPGVPDRGLSQLFERDSLIRDCVRNTGTESDRGPGPSAPGLLSRP